MSSSGQFEVYVRTLTGKTLPLRVAGSDIVLDLKRKLHDKTGLPPESQVCNNYTIFSPSQRVLFSGKQLEDSRTLDSYGIAKEATLFLVVNVKTESKEQEKETKVKEEKKEAESVWQVDAVQSKSTTSIIFTFLYLKLIKPLAPLFKLIKNVFSPIFKALCKLFSYIFKALSKLFSYIWKALSFICTKITSTIKFVYNTLRPPIKLLVINPIQHTLRWISSASRWAWNGAAVPAFQGISSSCKWLYSKSCTVVSAASRVLTQTLRAAGRLLQLVVIRPLKWTANKVSTVLNAVMDGTAQGVQWMGNMLHHSWNFIDNYLVTPIWDSVKYVVNGTVNISKNYVIAPIFRTTKRLISQLLHATADYIIAPIFRATKTLIKGTYNICKDYVIVPIFRMLKRLIKGTYNISKDYIIVPIFRMLKSLIKGTYNICKDYVTVPIFRMLKKLLTPIYKIVTQYVLKPVWLIFKRAVLLLLDDVITPAVTQVLKMVQGLFIDPLLRLYNYIKLTYFTTGVKKSHFTLGVKPGKILKIADDHMLVLMSDGQQYSVYIANQHWLAANCRLYIDDKYIGMFRLQPQSAYSIERTPNHEGKFTFIKDKSQGAKKVVLNDVKGIEKGIIKAVFTPQLVQQRRHRRRGAAAGGFSAPKGMVYNSRDARQGGKQERDESKEEEEAEAESFVSGETVFTGHSNQALHKVAWTSDSRVDARRQPATGDTVYISNCQQIVIQPANGTIH